MSRTNGRQSRVWRPRESHIQGLLLHEWAEFRAQGFVSHEIDPAAKQVLYVEQCSEVAIST